MAIQPPTATGHPLFGSMLDLQRDALGTYLKAQQEHGDVVRFVAGPPGMRAQFYGVFSPAGAQQVLAQSAATFRKDSRFYDELRASFGNGLLTSQDEEHMRQRRLLNPLFSQRQVDSYCTDIAAEAQELTRRWDEVEDATVDAADEMARYTLRVIARLLFGTGGDLETALGSVKRNFPIINAYAVKRAFSPVNIPRKVPTPGNTKAAKAHQELYDVCDQIIAARQDAEAEGESDRHDMLSVLARARDENGEPLSAQEIREQVLVFLVTGHESTATSLSFAMHMLALNPDAQARAHAEVDAVLEGRIPGAGDMAQLPYLNQVIKETLRLYPAAPSFGRSPDVDVEIGEYVIPAGSDVLVSPGVIQRRPDIWEDPDLFDPERFLPEKEAERGRYTWFPFGGGPRACVGQHLAMLNAVLTLGALLQKFEFTAVDTDIPMSTGVTLRAEGPVRVKLAPRG
ncbi:cytochrome P450 [Streptomyces sp. NPDC051555]|uniref:cytochrome P450 n=1 Tax=Streptomyces sp. NPDC051555 TaxID=3365657 RepID=UPI003789AAA1